MSIETVHVKGKNVIETLKGLLKKSCAHHIVVKNDKGKVLIDLPVTLIAAGSLLDPLLAGVSFVLALVKDCSIEITPPSDT